MATQHTKQKMPDEPTAEHNVLEITNASVAFAMERGDARVLDDVSINVRRGEVLGVVGESGSGKSMLADSMLDAIDSPGTLTGDVVFNPPEGGEPIKVNDLSKEELRRFRWERVSMVVQGALDSFNPTLSIGDHFVETLRAHDYDIQEGMERARQLISDVHLEPDRVLDAYPHELSGGMKQRALIALSLILDPDVLVMDEPTAALDLLMQQSILKLLSELKAEYDLTIVIVTHDLSHVARISDRLAVMYAFELLELGPVQDIVMDPAHPYTRELLNSIPDIDADLDEMASIEGTSPDPLNVPKGCSYHTRCPLADEQCRATNPDLIEVSEDHGAACFYTDEARERIPLKKEVSK
ncbi:ABC transporter ATP-binding protein [Haloferax sp. Atlit-10N]|uniref:ABC transporter ATP-binding protein n=1 Tax=unclassified Haloferax TaxID=2625095 RepID=UPI000E250223|nr:MULTISPECIES: ABC transporter ATP-binding protein [unclassified Haloferax]RDZ39954.1 ABC transporter ATP-binding protein [Haloferax sp. Atlit-16N]RDZ56688.1 ABC transporter ATP-binding protein [Haloferax sp. Atlit-10N]